MPFHKLSRLTRAVDQNIQWFIPEGLGGIPDRGLVRQVEVQSLGSGFQQLRRKRVIKETCSILTA